MTRVDVPLGVRDGVRDGVQGDIGAAWRCVEAPRSLRATLSVFRNGRPDPTTRLTSGRFVHATFTPDGPGTLTLTWRADPAPIGLDGLDAAAWGPGADWLLARVDRFVGSDDHPVAADGVHPVVARALDGTRTFRIGSSGLLYHQLLPVVLAQRITAGEAIRQWRELCDELGAPAPGPAELVAGMRLPPSPDDLRGRPPWWFHPIGIEAKRARTLTEIARHPQKMFEWADEPIERAAAKLHLIPGVGPWTVGSVLGPCLGDPDAVVVGDYHFPNTIAWALAGEARADDDRMLELLAPYVGQRGRVQRALVRTSGHAPKFGPRQRVLPMRRW